MGSPKNVELFRLFELPSKKLCVRLYVGEMYITAEKQEYACIIFIDTFGLACVSELDCHCFNGQQNNTG